ncbi:MAG: adenosylmethionine decarboxylase [Parachlamydiales bacterium]|nr:adenosylmethionine decarboxylase [Parachlamydiales bacterium]
MIRVLCIAFAMFSSLFAHDEHYFRGKHFIASYLDCDLRQLSDLEGLIQAMDGAVAASNATVLDKASYVFPPNGLTIVYLLSESHASLHTYPEHGACFIDLFTCGDVCSSERFHEAMLQYLRPKQVSARLFLRQDTVEELPFP